MKVLVFSQYFWPESFRINELVWSMQRQGVHVTVLTGKPNYPEGNIFDGYRGSGFLRQEHNGVTIFRVPIIPRFKARPLQLFVNYLSFIISAGLIGPFLLRRQHIDIIFVYAPSPLLQALAALPLKWTKRAVMVTWVQDLWPQSLSATGHIRNRWVLKAVGLLVRFIYHRSDLVLIQSEAFRQAVGGYVNDSKIQYFPNPGGDRTTQGPLGKAEHAAADSIPKDVFSVVFAGNLGEAQSLETILDAALALRDQKGIRFFLFGEGSRAGWLRDQVVVHRLENIVLVGRHPAEAMPAVFARASALLVTLKDEYIFSLTIPSKVQAYLAAGRPIIAAVNGEGGRIVNEAGAGIVCAAGDGRALAEAVLELADQSESVRQQMGEAGRRYFETHFDLNKLTAELVAIFNRLVRV